MKIAGLQKTTLLDYPGHVAATIFLAGCNMRCSFCHNMNLVTAFNKDKMDEDSMVSDEIPEADIFDFLNKRSSILDGVCITGGEATLNPELADFIRRIKEIGLKVKLDTNGSRPEMLRRLIDEKLIDYVAMDIKSSFQVERYNAGIAETSLGADYYTVCGNKNIDLGAIRESIDILLDTNAGEKDSNLNSAEENDKIYGFDYEFRTTVIKQYHNEKTFESIGRQIQGAKNYYLQCFLDSEYVLDHELSAYSRQKLESFAQIMRKYVVNVGIRGV